VHRYSSQARHTSGTPQGRNRNQVASRLHAVRDQVLGGISQEISAALLALARENGRARYDVIAVVREHLARTYPGRKPPIPL
jgi:hypothetical protein